MYTIPDTSCWYNQLSFLHCSKTKTKMFPALRHGERRSLQTDYPGLLAILSVMTLEGPFRMPENVRNLVVRNCVDTTRMSFSVLLERSHLDATMLQKIRHTIPAKTEALIRRTKCGKKLILADALRVLMCEMGRAEQDEMAKSILEHWRNNGRPDDVASTFRGIHCSMDLSAHAAQKADRDKMNGQSRTYLHTEFGMPEDTVPQLRDIGPFKRRKLYCCRLWP